jgi:hypothetical protein
MEPLYSNETVSGVVASLDVQEIAYLRQLGAETESVTYSDDELTDVLTEKGLIYVEDDEDENDGGPTVELTMLGCYVAVFLDRGSVENLGRGKQL